MKLIPLAHYEQRYAISEEGFIKNLANNSMLNPTINPNGYLKVGLANGDGTHQQELLHRLVALHFLPYPTAPFSNLPQVIVFSSSVTSLQAHIPANTFNPNDGVSLQVIDRLATMP